MGNSQYIINKTINLHEKKDPYRNLWRNVLIVAIEDLLKKRELQIKFKNKKLSLEEIWFHHDDFKQVCEWSELDPDIVRKRVYEAIERIKNKYEKSNMSKMHGKWLYKSETINRPANRHSTTMYPV